MSTTDSWYCLLNGQPYGPLSNEDLDRMIAVGQLAADSLLWKEGMSDWRPAIELGLSRHETVPPPPPVVLPPLPASNFVPSTPIIAQPQFQQPQAYAASTLPLNRRTRSRDRGPVVVIISVLALSLAGAMGWIAHSLVATNPARISVQANPSPVHRSPDDNRDDRTSNSGRVPTRETDTLTDPASGRETSRAARTSNDAGNSDSNKSATERAQRAVNLGTASTETTVADEAAVSRDEPDRQPKGVPSAARTESSDPLPTNPPATPPYSAAPKSATPSRSSANVIYQEIDIERKPQFNVLGTVMAQDLKYQIVSELRIDDSNPSGDRLVEQTVVDTRLIRADELSKASFTQSLDELKGWRFTYRVNAFGDVKDLVANPKLGRKAIEVEPKGSKGFLVTSVMDPDGWREMAELSFLVPPEQSTGRGTWTRQMMHDYGPLGSWYGETRYRKGKSNGSILSIDFAHQMTYTPPKKGGLELPFAINEINFTPQFAGGTVEYDTQSKRVRLVQERFVVHGVLATDLAGQSIGVEIEESQAIQVRLLEQYR